MSQRLKTIMVLSLAALLVSVMATVLLWWPAPLAAQAATAATGQEPGLGRGLAFIAAALATGLSSLGAAYAVASVGAAAVGALAEKPELLGRLLIVIGLAEGIAIYGLIISIMILARV
ncbi:ATP synthase subunit C [Ramlibacter sp. 2FC]|uniref:ATP synthase subunit C n=1 Tax=Ramlibacter sp. 2FC TaxID=2502188 RepID=UPI0010F968C6|nr:ATP synthase subunit C [Ramlibacter sp. 2FC]